MNKIWKFRHVGVACSRNALFGRPLSRDRVYGQWVFRLSVLRIRETTKETLSAAPFEQIALQISHFCLSHLRDENRENRSYILKSWFHLFCCWQTWCRCRWNAIILGKGIRTIVSDYNFDFNVLFTFARSNDADINKFKLFQESFMSVVLSDEHLGSHDVFLMLQTVMMPITPPVIVV